MQVRDVVVVGAGPVGLTLALGLARRGCDVLVLEKESSTAEHSRAPAIWPPTQEILAGLGVIDAFLAEGIALPRLEPFDVDRGSVLFSAPLDTLANETPFPQLLILPQSRTEHLLLETLLREPKAEVRFGCEVTGLDSEPSHVVVEYQQEDGNAKVAARWVAGCDGAHSRVREAIGASFDGQTYRVRAALADVEIQGAAGLPFPRLTTQPRLAIGIRMQQTRWRLILPFAPTDEVSLDRRIADAVAALFAVEYRAVWQSEFRLHRRISSRFSFQRIALAGDAAHLNSPVGGQGMNAGMKDAALLTEALCDALRQDSEEPLRQYARRRRKEVRQGVNRFTDLLTRLLLGARGRAVRPVFRLAGIAFRVPPLRRRLLRRIAMLR